MGRKIRRLLSSLLVLVTAAAMAPCALAAGFADVAPDCWYAEAVDYVVSNGLFSGTGEDVFDPDAAMTRGMLVTVLSRLAGADTAEAPSGGFPDVEGGEWYAASANWAVYNGYAVPDEDGCFRPNEPVTREEAADILARYLIAANAGTGDPGEEAEAFADAESVSDRAAASVEYMRAAGLMSGDESGNFNPQKGLTRAEAAAVFMRVGERTASEKPSDVPTEAQPDADGRPSMEDFRGMYEYVKDAVSYQLKNNTPTNLYAKPLSEWEENGRRLRMNCAEFVTYTYVYWLQTRLGYELDYAPELSDLNSDSLHFMSAYGWLEWAQKMEGEWDCKSYSGYRSLPKTRAMEEIKEDMESGDMPVGSLVIFSAMDGKDVYKHIGIYVGKGEDGGYYIMHCTKTNFINGVQWETIDDIVNRPGASIRPRFAINIVSPDGE